MATSPTETRHSGWSIDVPMAIISVGGKVTGWSEGARQLLGYGASEVVGHPVSDLLINKDSPEVAGLCLIEAREWSGAAALRHRDGHRVDVNLHLQPSLGDDGTARTFVVTATAGAAEAAYDRLMVEWAFAQSSVALSTYTTTSRTWQVNAVAHGGGQPPPTGHVTGGPAGDEGAQTAAGHVGAAEGRAAEDRAAEDGQRQVAEAGTWSYADLLDGDRADEGFLQCVRRVAEESRPMRYEHLAPAAPSAHRRAWTIEMWPVRNPDTGRLAGVGAAAFDSSEQEAARQRLALLNESGARIGTTLNVTRTVQELASLAVPRFADSVSVDLVDTLTRGMDPSPGPADAAVVLRRVAHQSADGVPEADTEIGEAVGHPPLSPPARALTTGRTVLCGAEDPDFPRWVAAGLGRSARGQERRFHSIMATPLRARGSTLGVAVFARMEGSKHYEQDDLILAEALVSRAAGSVDNARRFSRERANALTLQRSLLPRQVPEQAAVEVAHRYLPIGRGAEVGGDWFDVVPLSGTRVALVVGDVVGHGIHASAAMGRLRTAVRTLAGVDLPPDELLTHLDELITHLTSDNDVRNEPDAGEIGATCLYAVYDPVSRICTLASAGHVPPTVLLPDGTASVVRLAPGPLLGVGGLPFESTELELPEGSLLSFYTDGLIEARGQDLGVGLERLRGALASAVPSLDGTCDIILKALLPESPADDVALLLVRTRALHTDQVAAWSLPSDPAIVADARAQASRQLAIWGLADAASVTELVVSELVTNAIRYGDAPIGLRLIRDRTLICEVSDASSTSPHLRHARTDDEGGRGLDMVSQLTQGWGTRQTPTGKTIWAEQRLPAD
ncbi:SpoIIE family protein phosphatase [Streptomyces sp. bgisy100]|uniref:ATP-binding SpoIIE family protein phosphatase n=1 Tax=Streptomyces sp. bgisy100 TaxID=3413783 RepID=UPI003D70BD70